MGRLLACRILLLATEGNVEAIKVVLDRVDGRVRDELSLKPPPEIRITTNVLVGAPCQDTLMPGTTLPLLEEPQGTED